MGKNCHRGALRCVSMADNDNIFATSSMDSVKIWNAEDRVCTKSIDCPNVVSMLLLPPNKHILLGTKTGDLLLYTIASNECIQTISAHKAEIWGMDVHMSPMDNDNDILIVTGSADKTLKFWTLDLVEDKQTKTIQLQLSMSEEVETTDEVMGVKFSPDGKFICFSLLDSTIKINYVDTKKLFLSLYGHNLPVLSFDISSDSNLLVSASADKNVKLWGMDFGDCHKSIFCHDDAITTVKFVRDTHYFFTGSKDNTIKYYDGDKHEEIQIFEQNFGYIWGLSLSYSGDQVITVSADSSIRIYKQTKQQLFLEEEREKRLEKLMIEEGDLDLAMLKPPALDQFAKDKVMKIESETALKGSIESVKYGEDLMEAVGQAEKFRQDCLEYKSELDRYQETIKQNKALAKSLEKPLKPKLDYIFEGNNIFDYILSHLKKIRRSELENSLKFLNFTVIKKMMYYIEFYIRNGVEIELITKVLIFFIRGYQAQIYGCEDLKLLMTSIYYHLSKNLKLFKERIGINQSAIKLLLHQIKYLDNKAFENQIEDAFTNEFDMASGKL